MRVWLPVTVDQIAVWQNGGELPVQDGFAVTNEWSRSFDDDDPEVLEDEALRAAASGQAVVVVEAAATVVDAVAGTVCLDGPIIKRQIQAFFAKSNPDDDVLSWFGPTEARELLDFARSQGQ